MIKCTVGAVVYQGAWNFLGDFFRSIENQKMTGGRDFEILILNDDCDIKKLHDLISENITGRSFKVFDYSKRDSKMTPALFRMELLKKAKSEGAELLVVGDCDDVFTPLRVDRILQSFDEAGKYAFYYNNLVLEDGTDVFKSIPDVVTRDDVMRKIGQGNFLGMGTCAIDMGQLSDAYIESLCDADVTAYDWYLFTRIAMDIGPGKYVPDAPMKYRLYDSNAAGITALYDQKNLTRELNFKRMHYELLGKRYPEYAGLSKSLEEKYLEGGDSLDYWQRFRNHEDKGLWWNLIEI